MTMACLIVAADIILGVPVVLLALSVLRLVIVAGRMK
jgi:hypothetical protein